MKQFYLIVLCALSFQFAFSAPTIIADQNGNWNAASTWNLNRKPANGDTIVIANNRVVTIYNSQTLNNVHLRIEGTLRFANLFTYLSLNAASKIQVNPTGRIEATLNYVQYLTLGGQTIFYAHHLVGPVAASSTSNGFVGYDPLPVKFVGFTASRKNTSDVLVQWSTAEEINAYMYEVERSYDGSEWNTIAYVSAVGDSRNLNSYSYIDKNITARVTYYRVRQVDVDSRFTFTDIKSVKTENQKITGINIASVQGKVLLQFPKEIKGNMIVRFVSLSGQVVDQQSLTNPAGQVILTTKSNIKGNYVISVSNGKDMNVAKQVIL